MERLEGTEIQKHAEENRAMFDNMFCLVNTLISRQKIVLEQHGITHSQYNILKILKEAYPKALNVKELLACLVFGNPDITRLINRLINKDLVQRALNQIDRRKIDVTLTEAGEELLQILTPLMEGKLNNFFLDEVSFEEASAVNLIFGRLRSALALEM